MLRKNSPVGPDYSRGGVVGAISADFSVGKYRWWFIKWECSSVGRVPLMAIHYSLLLLRVIIFPFPQPASTRPTAWSARIPPHHRTLCILGLSIPPTILANIITPWDYEFCIRLDESGRRLPPATLANVHSRTPHRPFAQHLPSCFMC